VVTAGVRLSVLARRVPRLAAALVVLRLLLSDRVPAHRVPHHLDMAHRRPGDAALQLRLSFGTREKTLYDSVSRTTRRSRRITRHSRLRLVIVALRLVVVAL